MENKLPERLKIMRERNRLKRSVLSELCGLNRNAVKLYEKGESEPLTSSLVRIADFFDVSTDYLLGRSDNPKRF